MNDAGTETAWRIAYLHINEEIENMDQYMPGLEGIKAIWDEFLPAYQGAVAAKAAIFVRDTYNYIAFRVPSASWSGPPRTMQRRRASPRGRGI